MKRIGLVFLFLFILSANALATDYYVKTPANGGSDTNMDWPGPQPKRPSRRPWPWSTEVITSMLPQAPITKEISFHASDNNQLLGGYPAAGGGTRAPWSNPTIISGTSLTGSVISIPGNFTTSVGYSGIVIDGFTVKNGSKSTADTVSGLKAIPWA